MRLFTCIIFLLTIQFQSLAQPFQSLFGSDSTRWLITYGNLGWGGINSHTVIGDTLINGTSYKIIDGYSINGFTGYLREDTVQGKAWYLNNQSFTEFLIMDMELDIGDSMYIGGNWNPSQGYYKVDSIYYLNNRKHIQFDFNLFFANNEKFKLIEGISSNMGFRFQDLDYVNNFNPGLVCAFKNQIQVYGPDPCIYHTNNEEVNRLIQVDLYPNPVENYITIDIPDWKNERIHYQIIDALGSVIDSNHFNNSTNNTIDLHQLNNGVYVLFLQNEQKNQNSARRIIKMSE